MLENLGNTFSAPFSPKNTVLDLVSCCKILMQYLEINVEEIVFISQQDQCNANSMFEFRVHCNGFE